MDRKILNKILEAGIQAPSGDNSQPWRFKTRDSGVDIYCEAGADDSYYDFKNRGSLIANGAAIENIIIAAAEFGYKVNVSLFPDKKYPNLTAHLEFKPGPKQKNDFYKTIFARTTNRKEYKKTVLLEAHKKELQNLAKKYSDFKLILIDDPEAKQAVAEALSFNDRFFLEDKHTHDNLFSKIHFTAEKADHVRTGFYIKTMELNPMAERMMKLFRNWRTLTYFRKLGVAKMITKTTASLYNTSSAIGVVVMEGKRDEDFVAAGRFIERLWLTANSLGVAFAPVTAVPYLASLVTEKSTGTISKEHIRDIVTADKVIREAGGIKNETIAMVFRLGYADKPTAYSNRLPLSKVTLG